MKTVSFPFSAVVGQAPMKRALKVVAVDPEIDGVLVKGPRGTGKSTLSRGLAEILPEQTFRNGCPLRCPPEAPVTECPFCKTESQQATETDRPRFVELPLGATPDQVIGSLSIEEAVNKGRKRLNPGLLARANRGILYVDEVNLLPDRLVDLLLDVAASGVNRVERDGLSLEHPSDFLLIGTMNPDEGRLRPQLRDRFGLCVRARNQTDPDKRETLAQRASAFKTDSENFRQQWCQQQNTLRRSILDARERLPNVTFNEGQTEWIAHRVLDSGAEGHRADVAVRRTARSLAALREREEVRQRDLEDAYELAIEHRRSPDPGGGERPPETSKGDPFGGNESTDGHEGNSEETVIESREARLLRLEPQPVENFDESNATRLRQNIEWESGRHLNLIGTLRSTCRRSLNGGGDNTIRVRDLELETAQDQHSSLLLWVVDTSASMARNETIGFVKSVVKNRLRTDRRLWTGLVNFRGRKGSTVVAPTRRHEEVLSVLENLPVGGRTPFVEGLETARSVLEAFHSRHHGTKARTIVVSDGRVELTGTIIQSVKTLKRRSNLQLVNAELSSSGWGMIDRLGLRVGVQPVSLRKSVA